MNNSIDNILGQLSDKELRQYVLSFLKSDDNAADKFNAFLKEKLSQEGVAKAEARVANAFYATKNIGDRWHSYEVTDWNAISDESSELFSQARNAIDAGNPEIALVMGVQWLESFAENNEEMDWYDEEDYYFSYDCEEAASIIEEAMAHPQTSQEMKKEAATRISDLAKKSQQAFEEYNYLDITGLATRITVMSLGKEEALKALDKLLEDDFNNATLIIQKYRLLINMDKAEEAEAFVLENTDNEKVAEFYINLLFDSQEYKKLEPLLEDLTDTEYYAGYHLISRLQKLAICYDANSESEKATATYAKLFINSNGDLQYYDELKNRVPAEQWSAYLADLMQKTSFHSGGWDGKCNRGEILVKENLLHQLHDWLKDQDKYAIQYYLKYVPQDLRGDLLPRYAEIIRQRASEVNERKAYARICGHIATMNELPDGKPFAQALAQEIREKYSRKRAFQDELRQVMGK